MRNASLLNERLAFFLCSAVLFVAPLVRGGNRQISLIVLLALGLLLLAVLGAGSTYSDLFKRESGNLERIMPAWRNRLLLVLLLSPVWVCFLHVVPLSVGLWILLPGRDYYFQTLQAMGLPPPTSFSLSLSPDASWASALAGLPVVAIFAAAQILPIKAIKSLLYIFLVSAALQVLLSVLQLALGVNSIFYFDAYATGSVIGSFANRNHLANFLVMSLPVCLGIFFDQLVQKKSKIPTSSLKPSRQIIQVFLLFLGFSFILIILTTLSRGGLISGFVALGVSIWVYLLALGSKVSRKNRLIYLGLIVLFITLALLASGLEGIQLRLGQRFMTDAEVRNAITYATFSAAQQFWPWGSGLGSFEAVFPRFQPSIIVEYIEYAHNDYAQLLMELGFVGLILMVIFMVLVIHQLLSFIDVYQTERRFSKNMALQCFCGTSLLAFLLHSWVDFNMHIPALAITAAFLGGVFLRKPD